MVLSKKTLAKVTLAPLDNNAIFGLPEKVLQFGTGALLRGLPDYFIDKANKAGIFNGRIVVVKSTDQPSSEGFHVQDNLYTVCVRGYESSVLVKENSICAAISRVLSAKDHWDVILSLASCSELKIVVSNTTEAGIQFVEDLIEDTPPVSFPGKLLAFLYRRYQYFQGSAGSGMIVIPTELIPNNGKQLFSIILKLIEYNKLEPAFRVWLEKDNYFCNSLVDRIVPGKPDVAALTVLEADLGYTDSLLIMAEPYKLWAIEAPDAIKEMLSFYKIDPGIIVEPTIDKHRELKLRLLNGTHTFCCAIAFLSGFRTVREAMQDNAFLIFVTTLIHEEIAPAMAYPIDAKEKRDFADRVLDRFRNPTLEHEWFAISYNYTSKMRTRNAGLIKNYFEVFRQVPKCIAFGFAAYLYFMKIAKIEGGNYFGVLFEKPYSINDERASYFAEKWKDMPSEKTIAGILQDKHLWEFDLNLPDFAAAVHENLLAIERHGMYSVLNTVTPPVSSSEAVF